MSFRLQCAVFTLAFGFGLAINELNLHHVKTHNPGNIPSNSKSTVHGYTIWSIDNEWYLKPANNLLEGRGYTMDPRDPRLLVRRTPGYPFFYLLHRLVFGERRAFLAIRYTQLALAAAAAVLLGRAVLALTGQPRLAKATMLVQALCPFPMFYAYYTVTEALHPALVTFAFFCFTRALRSAGLGATLLAGAAAGIAALVRPLDGLLLPAFLAGALVESVLYRRASGLRTAALVAAGFLLTLAPWAARNALVTGGDVVLLEKYYDDDPMGYGRAYIGFRTWWSSWDNPSAEAYVAPILEEVAAGGSPRSLERVERFLDEIPPYGFAGTSREDVRLLLLSLEGCLHSKLSDRLWRPWTSAPCDAAVGAGFDGLRRRFQAAAPLRYFVLTPLANLRSLVFQSFSSAFGSLNPEGRRFGAVQVVIKGLLYALNAALWTSYFWFLLSARRPPALKAVMAVFPLGTLAYVLLLQRYLEVRYLLQAYPFLAVALADGLVRAHGAWTRARAPLGGSDSGLNPPPES